MDKTLISETTKWVSNIVAYSIAIAVPLMGYLLGIEVLQNFGVAVMVMWSLLVVFGTAITAVAVIIAYFMDNVDSHKFCASLANRNLLYYFTRIMSVVVAVLYIVIGYPLCGVMLLGCAMFGHWLHNKAIMLYKERTV